MQTIRLWYHLWSMAYHAVLAHKVRSIFAVLAVSLGIASLLVIIASIQGAEKKAEEIVSAFGSDAILIFAGALDKGVFASAEATLTKEDVRFIKNNAPQVKYAVPMRNKAGVLVKYRNKSALAATVVGTESGYNKAWRWKVIAGRELQPTDIRQGENVVLLGETIRKKLFPDTEPLGKKILLNNTVQCTVVGILEERSAGGLYDVNDTIIMPITTLMQRLNITRNRYDSLRILFHDSQNVTQYAKTVRSILRYTHNLASSEKDNFTIVTPEEVLRFMNFVKGGITVFLLIAALGALMVGGFVLANLFYISVAERTVEIGLKKALGVPARYILWQLLLETSFLTFLGAVGGIFLGFYIGFLLEYLDVIVIAFSWYMFILAFVVAWIIGFLFVLHPAKNASNLQAIQALKGDV